MLIYIYIYTSYLIPYNHIPHTTVPWSTYEAPISTTSPEHYTDGIYDREASKTGQSTDLAAASREMNKSVQSTEGSTSSSRNHTVGYWGESLVYRLVSREVEAPTTT